MSVNPQQAIVISLGFVMIWGIALAMAIYPFVSKRDLQDWHVALWLTSLVGVVLGVMYTVMVFNATNAKEVQRLVDNVPYCILVIPPALLFVLIATHDRITFMRSSLEKGLSHTETGKDKVVEGMGKK